MKPYCALNKSAILILLLLTTSKTIADDISGHIGGFAGLKILDSGDWPELNTHFAMGILFDIKKDSWPVSVALDIFDTGGEYKHDGVKNLGHTTEYQLGMQVRNSTGMDLSEYFETRVWRKIGAAHQAYWIEDKQGMEAAFGGFNATLRDYARFGLLYLHNGKMLEEQVVPADWVYKSITPDAAHLLPGENNPYSNSNLGYGFQWWIPEGDEQEFIAIGVYNQFIYVNPSKNIVIVKHSSNLNYKKERQDTNNASIAFFRAISTAFESSEMSKARQAQGLTDSI